MNKFLLLFVIFFLQICNAQEVYSNTNKTADFIKVWGLLKYHYPKEDWDNEFLENVIIIDKLDTKENINNFYSNWLKNLKLPKLSFYKLNEQSKFNIVTTEWIKNSHSFNQETKNQLLEISSFQSELTSKKFFSENNPNNKIILEKSYPIEKLESKKYRLLDLARFWNIIEYFYPYKTLIDNNWDDTLNDMIQKFAINQSKSEYSMLLLELINKVDDSHNYLKSPCGSNCFGEYKVPFWFTVIDDKIYISKILNEHLISKNDLIIGDEIIEIENQPAIERLKEHMKYVNGSNDNAKYNYSNLTFFAGESDKLNLKIKRNDSIVNKVINRYTSKDIFQKKSINKNAWKNYGDDILYIDYGLITNIELNSVLKASQNKKGIIIDLRNAYQEITLFKLADFLIGKKVHFANIINQNFSYPGSFSLSKQYCGKNNVNSFNGKIVLLVNENTQSHTEFAAMCLQQSPNTITIGSQSSGADGNVFELPLVFEGFSSIFTGIGVTYPDNTQSQRSGVKIDYEIEKNKKSIIENQDTYLKKALELLE